MSQTRQWWGRGNQEGNKEWLEGGGGGGSWAAFLRQLDAPGTPVRPVAPTTTALTNAPARRVPTEAPAPPTHPILKRPRQQRVQTCPTASHIMPCVTITGNAPIREALCSKKTDPRSK